LPCSKELYPLVPSQRESNPRPRVVSQFLLERMRSAGIRKAFLVIRGGKWDFPASYSDGAALLDMHLAYVVARLPYRPPFSLDAAFPFVSESTVAMGFPDILFGPGDVFSHLLGWHAGTRADLVLGLFRLPDSVVDDRVELDAEGRVRRFFLNQALSHLQYSWLAAVWAPSFTRFMHEHLREHLRNADAPAQGWRNFWIGKNR
jgi:glucose-1-phosphate thymidylyltransferase